MSPGLNKPIIGFPNEWRSFLERHPSWPTVIKNLHGIFEKAFIRDAALESQADKIIFFMGRLCVEDFNEVFLLAGNGYGFGSLKILRGLYERVVTMHYISENQEAAASFLEYHYIHRGKLIHHAESFFGDLEQYISKPEIEEAKHDFDAHKGVFMRTACKKCKTKSIMHSWSKLDLESMAKKTGLDKLYFPGYYYPTLQAHATTASLFYRLKGKEGKPVGFEEKSQPEVADRSLIIAHNLAIHVIEIQNYFFKLSLDHDLLLLVSDYKDVWEMDTKAKNLKEREV